jgi:hypothetical protein
MDKAEAAMKQLIEDLISAMEYHVEQTRPIHSTTVALQAAREALRAQPAPVQEPYAWHYKNAAGVSVWHFGPSRMFDADLEASKMWPRTHQLIPVYTENRRSISDCEELAALGWQAITCPSCGNVGARGYPRNTTPPAQPAAQEFVCSTGLCHYKAQRQWVGLTHDEYDAICDKHSAMSDFDFLADIETKLKEKNQ